MKSGVLEPNNVVLISNLAELRGDVSVAEVARCVGLSRKAIYDLEGGLSAPDRITLKRLLAFYKKPITFHIAEETASEKSG